MVRRLFLFFFLGSFISLGLHSEGKIELFFNSPIGKKAPSTECRTSLCKSLLMLINESKSSIDFAIYGLRGQKEIFNALLDAKNRGVSIRGVIDKDIHNQSYYSDTHLLEENFNIRSDFKQDLRTLKKIQKNKKTYKDKCKRPEGHLGPLQCFEGKGYASKKDIKFAGDIMHNKFFIFDKAIIWTGSANISDTGIGGYNANLAAIIESPYIADKYHKEFEQMYLGNKFHRAKNIFKKQKLKTKINNQEIELFFSPQGYAVYRGLIPAIKGAKKSIDISIFFLTHKNIAKELVNAKNRGVQVRVIIDATGASNEYSKHQYLRDKGIPVKVENWGGKMHMKSAIIDAKDIIVGSMNWTSAGESKNDENTIVIRNSDDAIAYNDFFEELWKSIPKEWLYQDTRSESKESINSCSDGIDNDFDKSIDINDSECK